MDEPLFGYSSNSTDKTIEKAVGGIGGLFVSLTILFGIINGFAKSGNHFFTAIALGVFLACEVYLIRWYRLGDVDPKFKYLILGLAIGLVLLSIVGNVYFWQPHCSGLYNSADGKCFSCPESDSCVDLKAGNCFKCPGK